MKYYSLYPLYPLLGKVEQKYNYNFAQLLLNFCSTFAQLFSKVDLVSTNSSKSNLASIALISTIRQIIICLGNRLLL